MKLQLLVDSWDIDLQVKYNKLYNYTKIMIIAVRFTGYAFVSHDNTWTGGFVAVNCVNGMESSLEDCDPLKVTASREDTCKSGNQARLLCEPGITIISL